MTMLIYMADANEYFEIYSFSIKTESLSHWKKYTIISTYNVRYFRYRVNASIVKKKTIVLFSNR